MKKIYIEPYFEYLRLVLGQNAICASYAYEDPLPGIDEDIDGDDTGYESPVPGIDEGI